MARNPAAGYDRIWFRYEYASSGNPWTNTTGKPSPRSYTAMRIPLVRMDRGAGIPGAGRTACCANAASGGN